MAEDEEAELLGYARLDWVAFGDWTRIHALATATTNVEDWRFEDVTTACGKKADRAFIPGVLSRLDAPRCSTCCERLGFPRGMGSPRNSNACRAVLGLPTRSTTTKETGRG